MVLEVEESIVEHKENFDTTGQRQTCFKVLRHVLGVSLEKFDKEKIANDAKLKWGRLLVNTIQTYGKLIEIYEIEDLMQRVGELEKESPLRRNIDR
jgi:ribulose 1,5-bisphosphate synthetase/thiazole synthase